jgi:diguanylate cyclase (GGDEF)-like protein
MFEQNRLSEQFELTRPVFAILAMIVVLMALAVTTLWWTAGETNRIDNERTARALANAVAGEVREVQSMAADNGLWNDAADAAYGRSDPVFFIQDNFLDFTRDSGLYDGAAMVDDRLNVQIAVFRGEYTQQPLAHWAGQGIGPLLNQARERGTAIGGLVVGPDGPRLVGISPIRPTSDEEVRVHELAGHKPCYLLFTRRLSDADIAEIGDALVVEGLVLEPAAAARGRTGLQEGLDNVIPLLSADGRQVAALRWEPSAPANRAVWQSLPIMGGALLIAIFASGFLLRRSYATLAQINAVALQDTLSDLPNRRSLRQMVKRALAQEQDLALAFVDLDGFKGVNDLYGHAVGDQLIVECAAFIRTITSKKGGAARLGGDEFAVFTYGPAAHARLEGLCDKLLERFGQPFVIGERTICVGASIGLTDRARAGSDVSELMRQADVAMYVAKRGGKMRTAWFSAEYDDERRHALDIENRLRAALDQDEFSLVYQPLIAARSHAVLGYEALLRWDSGMVPPIGPDQFIPIAEDSGLIDRIGEFVLQRACRDALSWPGQTVSVNVSAAQLRNPRFPAMVAKALRETGLPASRLMLEITETYIVKDPALARTVLDALRVLGIRVALDDFGSGFASIGFLRQFTFDMLKLDRTLVIDAIGDQTARALLHSSVAVARALGMQTVAEGIEDEAQALIMQSAGCDMLQGWYFGRETGPASLAVPTMAKPEPGTEAGDERRRA